MEIPKDRVLDLLKPQGKQRPGAAGRAGAARPGDPERDSGLLAKFGIEPQDLLSEFGGGIPGL